MLTAVRAGLLAALSAFAVLSASAQDKAFQRDDLADAAVRVEAQVKSEAARTPKPLAAARRDAEAALKRNDFRAASQALVQVAAATPDEASSWLRLAGALVQIRTNDQRERATLLERAAAAAYLAYQLTTNRNEEAESLAVIGRTFAERQTWRPAIDTLALSLDLRDAPEVRAQYERLRSQHGFRLLDYSVDSNAASPRACFQFSEALPGRKTDFSPFVSVAGMDRPALSTDERQLCVEGLKHGERYSVTLRAGLPSVIARESLARAASYTLYVRDRRPFVRFTGRAYVLPRSGQQGIPVVSVNTRAVAVQIFRIGDRSLTDTVLGFDFQRNLGRYELERLGDERGVKVWSGELAVESPLNAEVTTAFPIDQAVGELAPGVYVMTGEPASQPGEDFGALATQWFIVSDLGLAAFSGNDGVHVFVNSLARAEAVPQVEIRLISRGNEVLATRRTDATGRAHFESGLTRGEGGLAPALLVAVAGNDYAFLNLKTPAFDLSDRGVAGRPAPGALDAFVYTERGVYRSGETVHITSLLRDSLSVAADNVPLTLVVQRPDGVEYRRAVIADQGLGGRSLSVPIVQSAMSGTWRVRAFTDPKRPPVGETTFMVEDYVPDRIEFDLAAAAPTISRTQPARLSVNGRYLYGAPGAGLSLEGEVVVGVATQRPGFAGYRFGPADEEVTADRRALEDLPETDREGKAAFDVTLESVPAGTRPLEAQVTVRMAEPGGRAVERKLALPVTPEADMIGVRPLFSGRSLGEGEQASFDVVFVAPDGTPRARPALRYELLKIETRYQWYRHNGYWQFEPIKSTQRVADGRIDVTADKPARLSLPVQWGRYRLEVSTGERNGLLTSVTFDAGFYAEASSDTPDLLEVALDKPDYRPGETMTLAATARTAGRLTVDVYSDRLVASTTREVQPGTARVNLEVGRDWGSGAYVVATLRRPLDAQAQRMPGRAIGVQWFGIGRAARTLALDLNLPNLVRPNAALRIPVKVGGLAAGEEARIVVAAVDVGILNLTNYKPPAPNDYYLGQRRLSAEIRDLYGQLIDGMQGTRGRIRTGGDIGPAELEGSPPTQPPLALYSGIVTVGPDGAAEVTFDIPDFAGTARVMAIAWSKDKVGNAVRDLVVRDPVVVTATLPRFLLTGDRSALHLDIDNVDGAAGEYRLAVTSDGPARTETGARTIQLAARQRSPLTLPLTTAGVGLSNIKVALSGPDGFALERNYALVVKPSTQILARRTVRPIAQGESITLSSDLFADLVPGTGSVALSVGTSTALDAAALVGALDRYPFGCTEQIASRALPLLYVNELAAQAQLALDTDADERIRQSIDRLLARQGSNGSFGLWSVGGEDVWLTAYVTDLLTRARERGFTVSETALRLALDNLRNFVSNTPDPKEGGRELAYALYVLARNGAAPVGDLRYIADAKLGEITTPIGKAQIAAALAMGGDRVRAERVYAAALRAIAPQPRLEVGRVDYGSVLRDSAALVTLASEGGAPRATIEGAVSRVEAARNLSPQTSTQENAWLVLAARAIAKDAAGLSLSVDGQAQRGALYRTIRAGALTAPLRIGNEGEGTVQAVVTVSGSPLTPEPAAEHGFKIERLYYTLDGEKADPAKARQNQRFVVVLRVTERQPQFGRIAIADYLPAGFEIDNPRIVSSGDTGTLGWIENAAPPVSTEFRDDRFTAAFERKREDPAVFAVAYVVRAVSPGRYVLPQAFVEDMYRPDRFGRTATGTIDIAPAR
jgi:uncharacterized protein YfaS (alpha-2-macroglobulin family)